MRARYVVLLIAVALIAIRWMLPAGVFWISDAGNKYLVAQNFARGGLADAAIAYPAAVFDPGFRWFPTAGEHFRRLGDGFYSIVSFVFPWMNAPLVGAFGPAGATVLPLAAGIGLLLLIGPLVRALDVPVHPAAAVAVVAFATPLAFYSLDFWEHTTAMFFALLALLLVVKERPLLAGVALGTSIAFREEGYVLLAVLLIACAFRRTERRFPGPLFLGAVLVLTPLWIVNWHWYGNVAGLHLAAHAGGSIALPVRIARNIFYFLFQFHEWPLVSILLAAAPVAAVVVGAFRGTARVRLVTGLAVLVAAAIGLVLQMMNADPIGNTMFTQGLLLGAPLLTPFILRWRELSARADAFGLLALVVCLYIAVMPVVLRANWTGIIWGPRYFLTVLPAAVVLALGSYDRGRNARAVAAALVGVSIALQLFGLMLLQRKLDASAQLAAALHSAAPVVITDVFWLPEEMSSLYFEKQILMPANGRELGLALRTLQARGVGRVAVVSSPHYTWYSKTTRQAIAQAAPPPRHFEAAGVPLLTVDIYDVPLRARQ